MNCAINVKTAPDPDGDTTRVRKEVDLWGQLTDTQKTQVQRIYDAITAPLYTRYGESLILEGVRFAVESIEV